MAILEKVQWQIEELNAAGNEIQGDPPGASQKGLRSTPNPVSAYPNTNNQNFAQNCYGYG